LCKLRLFLPPSDQTLSDMQRLYTLIATLFFTLFLTAQENNPLINSAEYIKKGTELHDQGKYKEAIAAYNKIDKSDTNYYQAVYEMAYSLSADSQAKEALKMVLVGLQKPNSYWPQLYTLYGNLLDEEGQSEKALRVYDTAIALYPAFTALRLNKGTTYLILKKYSEAEAIFKECILINPYESSAHYKLGVSAMAQGKAIEAFLSYINYMLLQPGGKFQPACITQMSNICKSTDSIQQLISVRNTESEMPFSLVEKIVLSKIALDKNYKPLIKLDDPITRQIQVILEKLEYDENSKDFWMQYYVPLLTNIFKEKRFEPFIYRALSGVNLDIIQSYLKKNKDEQQDFVNYLVAYYDQIRNTRELNYVKRRNEPTLYNYEDGKLYGKGKLSADGKNFIGNWEFCYSTGNIRSIGKFNDKGGKEGEWKYYHYNGLLRGKQFYKNDVQEGEELFYFENGALSSSGKVKNGVADGETYTYYLVGSPKAIQNYKDGQLEGIRKTFYSNGNITTIETYRSDTLNGSYSSYFKTSVLESTADYKNGELEGPFRSYHENGKLGVEGQYKTGKLDGPLKRYHSNGQLKSKENYVNGEMEGPYTEYYDNGVIFYTTVYKKGKQDAPTEYFDRDGKKFSVYNFDNGILRSAKYFDKSGKEISFSDRKAKKLDLTNYSPAGFKKLHAVYNDKGSIEGLETSYYTSSKIRSESNYEDGIQTGRSTYFYANGNKESEVDYAEGEEHGYGKFWYAHGQIRTEGWYQEGLTQGVWLEYDELGMLKSKTTYRNNDMDGYREEYFPNGKLSSRAQYTLGWIENYIQFDTTGKEINRNEFKFGNGKIRTVFVNGKLSGEGEYKYGDLDGPYKYYFPDGSISTSQFYKKGLLDSTMRSYYYGGNLATEGTYRFGNKSGTWKHYLENGKLEYTEEYVNGQLHGKEIYYYEDGKIDTETEYYEGDRHGWVKKYDEAGAVIYNVKFEFGVPVAYTYMDKTGKLLPEIEIPGGNGKVKTYFPNGNVSAEFEYTDGLWNGSNIMYHANGKIRKQAKEVYNLTEGPYKYFHSNGQVELDYNFLHDNLHGPAKVYNEKGILTGEGSYYNGLPHGIYKTYDDNGKLKDTRIYYYGDLIEIKK
jgi:antitoxin component YwqK of YwqJK toxin-antitoxin module/Flp pilus assembly protein TadD